MLLASFAVKDGFLVHFQCGAHPHLQVLLCRTTFQPAGPEPVLDHRVILPHGQDWALSIVEIHEMIATRPFLQPAKVPLNSGTAIFVSATPLSFGSYANLLRVHCVLLSR